MTTKFSHHHQIVPSHRKIQHTIHKEESMHHVNHDWTTIKTYLITDDEEAPLDDNNVRIKMAPPIADLSNKLYPFPRIILNATEPLLNCFPPTQTQAHHPQRQFNQVALISPTTELTTENDTNADSCHRTNFVYTKCAPITGEIIIRQANSSFHHPMETDTYHTLRLW